MRFAWVFLVAFEPAGILANSWTSRDNGFHLLANVKCIQWWWVLLCHWQELSQTPFLSWQKFCHDKHVFVTTKHVFCGDKSMLVTTTCLLRHNFVATGILMLGQKTCFVMTNTCLSRQKYACHDKIIFVVTKSYVATNIIFSRQNFSHDKPTFVTTKMILVAAPTSDGPSRQALQISVEVWDGSCTPNTVTVLHKSEEVATYFNSRFVSDSSFIYMLFRIKKNLWWKQSYFNLPSILKNEAADFLNCWALLLLCLHLRNKECSNN